MNKLVVIVVALIMVFAGLIAYHIYTEPKYPSYHVDMHLNATNLTTYYPIHVNSNLTGNGTYQQLLTFSDPSHYGINANGSNLAFYDGSNNTHLYAWIQSMNNTSMQVWVKNYNASNVIDMQVLPSFENLFGATGYLGEAPELSSIYAEYDNGKLVFNGSNAYYDNFKNSSSLQGWVNGQFGNSYFGLASNGLHGNTSGSVGMATSQSFDFSNARMIGDGYFAYKNESYGRIGFGNLPNFNALYISGNGHYSATVRNSTAYIQAFGRVSILNNNTFSFQLWLVSDTTAFISYFGNTYSTSFPIISPNQSLGIQLNSGSMTWYYIAVVNLPGQSMPTFTIGSLTNVTDAVASYLSNSITIPMPNWFNLTLKAYTNYSFTFHYNNTPLYFVYDGFINNTFYTGFLDGNITLNINFIAFGYSGKTELIVVR